MKPQPEYLILEQDTIAKLMDVVQQAIDTGFEPLGGVAVNEYHREGFRDTKTKYVQALIKRS